MFGHKKEDAGRTIKELAELVDLQRRVSRLEELERRSHIVKEYKDRVDRNISDIWDERRVCMNLQEFDDGHITITVRDWKPGITRDNHIDLSKDEVAKLKEFLKDD